MHDRSAVGSPIDYHDRPSEMGSEEFYLEKKDWQGIWEGSSSHVATRGGLHHRVRCDMWCMHNRRTTCGGSAIPSRAGHVGSGMCGMWAAYIAYAVEGAGGVLDCVLGGRGFYLFILWKGGGRQGLAGL